MEEPESHAGRPAATSAAATCWGQVSPSHPVRPDDANEQLEDEEEAEVLPQLCFAGRFQLGHKIGSGSFSSVYSATDVRTGRDLAVKLESVSARHPQLLEEAKRYECLAGGARVPQVHWFGIEGAYNVMVMDLLGPSLEALFHRCDQCFSLSTTLRVAGQMLQCIRYVHSKGFVHRDVKPDNFAIGRGSAAARVHIVDFGLTKRYKDHGGEHAPWRRGVGFAGTARYASAAAHLGAEQSRRDDVEALGYVFVYFLHGELPWQGVGKGADKAERHRLIASMKRDISAEELCKDLPDEFVEYFEHCAELEFKDAPDYKYLQDLLERPLRHASKVSTAPGHFDWEILDEQTSDASR